MYKCLIWIKLDLSEIKNIERPSYSSSFETRNKNKHMKLFKEFFAAWDMSKSVDWTSQARDMTSVCPDFSPLLLHNADLIGIILFDSIVLDSSVSNKCQILILLVAPTKATSLIFHCCMSLFFHSGSMFSVKCEGSRCFVPDSPVSCRLFSYSPQGPERHKGGFYL